MVLSGLLAIAGDAPREPLYASNNSRGDDKADPSQFASEIYPDSDRFSSMAEPEEKILQRLHEMARLKSGLHRQTVRSEH
jgi:hypothetical protein